MNLIQVALYARVSSAQQADAHTVASQVAALRERVAADGLTVSEAMQFLDEGYSGATLVRPALERLRDVVAAGSVDRLYVHSPDRLARKYAYQVLLVDEFRCAGVEVIFLNHALGHSPEDALLLQVQGMIAEYERAKIIERHRRGKRHAARVGAVNVRSGAPYGYRYVTKYEGGGQARYEIIPDEARVVRQVFAWVSQDRLTIGEVCRRLTQAGEMTRTGRTVWDRSVVWGILKNPASQGTAAFGTTRLEPLRPRLRAQRHRPVQPRRAVSVRNVPRRTGARSRSQRSWSPRCARPSRNSCGRTRALPGNRAGAPGISCQACSHASPVALPSTGSASARVPGKASRVRTPLPAVWGRMPSALGASASATIRRCGPTCWTWRCGRKS